MSGQMLLFKDIISKSIPQALKTPTVWFSGYGAKIKEDKDRHDYYTGTFEDFLPVLADSGYSDDGDRTIELSVITRAFSAGRRRTASALSTARSMRAATAALWRRAAPKALAV